MGKTHFGGVVVSDSYFHMDGRGLSEVMQVITNGHKSGQFLILTRVQLKIRGGIILEKKDLPDIKIPL